MVRCKKLKCEKLKKPILFLFKFLTGRVGFYGLVNVESEPEPKTEFFYFDGPTPDSFGHSDLPVGLRVRSGQMGGSG